MSPWPYLLAAIAATLLVGVIIRRRREAIGLALATLLSVPLFTQSLGIAKPLALEVPWCLPAASVELIAGRVLEPDSIEAWVQTPCGARLYSLPYSVKGAEAMQRAMRGKGKPGHGTPMMRAARAGEASQDDQPPLFYEAPQPAPPPKDGGS